MRYQFIGHGCPNAGKGCAGCGHEIEIPMKKAPSIGAKRKCPVKGCDRKVVRILSTGIDAVVKGAVHDWQPGETMRYKMNGLDYGFQFIDHKHTDPKFQRDLAQMAGKAGLGGDAHGINNARYDEKLGRMVVDVASNIRDPLGTMERAKRAGQVTKETKRVNTPFRVRPKKGKR